VSQIENMERATQRSIRMEAKKMSAFVGYLKAELFNENGGPPQYELTFGRYNDRALMSDHVKHHVNSLLQNGSLQFNSDHALPVGIRLSDINREEPTKDRDQVNPPHIQFNDGTTPEVIAYGGQHRTAAVLELKTSFENQIKTLENQISGMQGKRLRANEKTLEQLERQQKASNERIKNIRNRIMDLRFWKVAVYDLGKLLS
jgi:hypothetical protein